MQHAKQTTPPIGRPIKLKDLIDETDLKTAFLAVLREAYTITAATRVMSISRQTVLNWRKADEQFNQDVDGVLHGEIPDMLESMSIHYGATRPQNFLDRAMMLKAKRPDEYKDRLQVDMSVTVSAQLGTARGIADIRRDRLKAANSSPVINLVDEENQDEAQYVTLENDTE